MPSTSESTSTVPLEVLSDRQQPTGWGRRWKLRLTILLIVQIAMIVHIIIWWIGVPYGWQTLSPVEPSEAIETVSDGIINAGAVFFAVALLSTAILGRWFCGWGCHVVLLQDGCLRLLRMVGIRPRAFRSRLLMLAPFLLALYMFVWPVVYRLVVAPITRPDVQWHGFRLELLTRDLWATMPGVGVAIVFLFLCGFVTVYVLGAKGFCTYGCPYGGFFMPLDKLALRRVHVNDDCRGCAHCTAVCTSNVRVHEQVATYGKVIDAGCMRTTDCIEACPNDALSMQWSLPVLGAKTRAGMSAPKTKWDLSWSGEITLAVIMFLGFLAWRGAYGLVPLLMSLGAASTLTWLCWKGWRLLRDPNASFHRTVLKQGGVWRRGGVVFMIVVALAVLSTMQAGGAQLTRVQGDRVAGDLRQGIYAPRRPGVTALTGAQQDQARAALDWYRVGCSWGMGGMAMASDPNALLSMARLEAQLGRLDQAARLLDRVASMSKPNETVAIEQLMLAVSLAPPSDVISVLQARVQAHPEWDRLRQSAVQLALAGGDLMAASRMAEGAAAWQYQAIALLQQGEVMEALPLLKQYVEARPDDVLAWMMLAEVQLSLGDVKAADEAVASAMQHRDGLSPEALADFERALQSYQNTREGQPRP